METYWVTEFGVEYWSYGGRFLTEAGAKEALKDLLRTAQKINPDSKVRAVKVTRQVVA